MRSASGPSRAALQHRVRGGVVGAVPAMWPRPRVIQSVPCAPAPRPSGTPPKNGVRRLALVMEGLRALTGQAGGAGLSSAGVSGN
jgi:hypothetical protein